MRHEDLIKQMTAKQKAAFLTGKNEWESREYPQFGIPGLFFSDGPSGVRRQEGAGDHLGLNPSVPATCFPSPSTLANSWEEQLEEKVGEALGREAVLQNIHVLLAPGLNIKRNPLCGRNFEYFSEDPYLSGKMAAAAIRGIQKNGVGACAKHFAVNSQEERRMALNAKLDEKTLRELYLTGFEIAVEEGHPQAVMSAYNEINGIYANENEFLLTQILRKEWGFDGFVVTDWGGGNDFTEGVKSGSTLQMPGCGLDSARELLQALEDGKITEEQIDERVDELLDAALTIPKKVAEKRQQLGNPAKVYSENHKIAEEAAEKSAVLLKNEDAILPLNQDRKIAIIGDFAFEPRYQGAGSSCVRAIGVETIVDLADKTGLPIVGAARGYQRNGKEDKKREKEALELAEQADVVLYFLGLAESLETEGKDRKDINIAQNQIQLLHELARKNPNIVAVLSTGSMVNTWWKGDCKAILLDGLAGEAGAGAVWKLLTGECNPSGKLTETWLRSYEDTPSYPDYPAKERDLVYKEGIFVGYRYFDKTQIPVSYPFGYGLSYTTFAYRDLRTDENGIRLYVKNTGPREGSEIVQMYISLPESRIVRPEKELKGFYKVHLLPGEEREVAIPFDDKTFRFFCERCGKWKTEKGTYQILVGASSQDIRLKSSVFVEGTRTETEESEDLRQDKQNSLKKEDKKGNSAKRILLNRNDPLSSMIYARNPVARLIAHGMKRKIDRAEKEGQPVDLNTLFRYNMPIRAIAKMTEGMVSMKMVDSMLKMVNGHFCSGLCSLVKEFFRNQKANKAYEKELKQKI